MGYATLDSIRAVQKSSNFTGIAKNATITLNGYSGGGISAAWVRHGFNICTVLLT